MQNRVQLVAIGASAGGIEAFRNFFAAMPADSGMAFVVVLHLSPNAKSLLPEILARCTAMTVTEAKDGDVLMPNCVYVIPPGVIASLRQGALLLHPMATHLSRPHLPIDAFFDSVAIDQGPLAVAIVLSGTGHDGSLGLKAIKMAGGLTMAQVSDGSVPEHSGMPQSAIDTGYVDLALGVDEMPPHILAFRRQGSEPGLDDASPDETEAARLRICAILQDAVGHDFSQYKDKTFLRRVERRMSVLGLETLAAYIQRIESEREEAVRLFRDLLIGVTRFFRDAETFEIVAEKVIPRIFEGKGPLDAVRVWVPGCATGEEAYSLAILLREHLDTLQGGPRVQIFATDIDTVAIDTARAGCYPTTLLDGMLPRRKARYFTEVQNGYLINKEIRDLCTFSPHSLVRDPPFSRMDLISCRNLLIYMDGDLQATIIPCFHYALLRGGFLLLGSSETVVRHEALFTPFDKSHRIFLRRDGPSPTMRQAVKNVPSRRPNGASPRAAAALPSTIPPDWSRALRVASKRVLERFAAPYAVVTGDGELLHYSSRVGNFLQPALGAPSRNIFDLVRPGLNLALRAALRSAVAVRKPVEHTITTDPDSGEGEHITLLIEPLADAAAGPPYLIVFQTTSTAHLPAELTRSQARGDSLPSDYVVLIARMDTEMQMARDELQVLTEEHESALEEVRSSNEELLSLNEELQSSNEELETSKEEIQSINEELQTVNAELSTKIDEVDRANGDLRHLFESTSVATIFLDQHFIIRNFTPEVAKIYNLIPSDRGRSLEDIVSALDYDTLSADVRRVLETHQPLERRVSRRDRKAHFLCRIILYRAPDGEVAGTLVTFIEVTNLVLVQTQQTMIDELNHRVRNMLAVVLSLANQTAENATSLDGFQVSFSGRIQALSVAYGLLGRDGWNSVDLAEILKAETRAFLAPDGSNITILGPPLALNANAALVLGMAVHELMTNAVKYGALSAGEGRIDVRWETEGGFTMDWTETAGLKAAQPTVQGFGMKLITRSIEGELSGKAKFDFLPEGLRVRIEAPLDNLMIRREPVP
jgi:two-component system CheB/CheR fusion protein